MTDDFIPLRTDGLPHTLHYVHCIALCITLYALHCIALHYVHCIAYVHACILTERNVNSTACLLLNCAIGHV
jgi:hypothetical protein